MAHANLYMSWTGVTITPSGGSAIALLEVIDVQFTNSDGLEAWRSDGNKYATLIVDATGEVGATIIGGDCFKLATLPRGAACTIVAILNDAKNKTGSGASTFTLVNAVVQDTPTSGVTNKFAGGSASFMSYSADGSTIPLSIAQAT